MRRRTSESDSRCGDGALAGVYTGSSSGDRTLRQSGFRGENHGPNETLAVKVRAHRVTDLPEHSPHRTYVQGWAHVSLRQLQLEVDPTHSGCEPSLSLVPLQCHLDWCADLPHVPSRYDRFVHLVRNPFDALVAERKRITGGGHVRRKLSLPVRSDHAE